MELPTARLVSDSIMQCSTERIETQRNRGHGDLQILYPVSVVSVTLCFSLFCVIRFEESLDVRMQEMCDGGGTHVSPQPHGLTPHLVW